MTDVLFRCPSCRRQLAIDEQGSGMDVDCPDCGTAVRVPQPAVYFDCPHCETPLAVPQPAHDGDVSCPACSGSIQEKQLLSVSDHPSENAGHGERPGQTQSPRTHLHPDTMYRGTSTQPYQGSAAPIRQGGTHRKAGAKSPLDDTIIVIVTAVVLAATLLALFILFKQDHKPLFEEETETPQRSRSSKMARTATDLSPTRASRIQSTNYIAIGRAKDRDEFAASLDVFTAVLRGMQQEVERGTDYASFMTTLEALYEAYDQMPNPPKSEETLSAWFRRFDAEANTALFYYEAAEKSWHLFVESEGKEYAEDFLNTNETRTRSFVWHRAEEAANRCLAIYREFDAVTPGTRPTP